MTASRDPDQLIHHFLLDGEEQLHDQVYDAVRADIEQRRQRVVIGPWRMPDMNKLVPFGLGAAALVAVLAIGSQLLGPAASSGVGAAPPAAPEAIPSLSPVGGTVEYQLDGASATTEVTAVADGASVSGTAVTTFVGGTHTVQLACANRNGDTWALAGTVEQTTVPGEKAGHWSVVIVRDGSPQHISIWLSADPEAVSDCDALASSDFSTIGLEDLQRVESGALVPPPDLAP
jgi:hypothetical protein